MTRAVPSRRPKRPLEDPPVPSMARRRPMPAQPELPPDVFVGSILNYDQGKGYGFIHCSEVPEGDIYFQRGHLPPEFHNCTKDQLKGQEVEVILHLTPDGKPRADKVRPIGPPVPRSREASPPRLSPAMIKEMTRYLEERGGAMDYGKFSRDFRGVKKAQLEGFFRLVPEEDDGGGRWQITLPDVEPLSPGERPERPERQEKVKAEKQPEPQEDRLLGRFVGLVSLFDPMKGYGFIKSSEVKEGDVYFKRSSLPPDAQELPKPRLLGSEMEFDCWLTAQGKVRAESIELLREADGPKAEPADGQDAPGRLRDGERARGPVRELDSETVEDMRRFLEDKGGAMDYGKFSNAFAGVKKQQLEAHFTLVMEGKEAGGRWQITLPGVQPLTTEEREAQEAVEGRAVEREPRGRPPPQEPSEVMWLVGCVRRWDQKKNFGFLEVEGLDDVFLHRNDLPPDLQAFRGGLQGAQLAFELAVNDEGRLRIKTARALLEPDGRGGWQLRRA